MEIPKNVVLGWVRDRDGALAAHRAGAVLPDQVDTRDPEHRRRLDAIGIDLRRVDPPVEGF